MKTQELIHTTRVKQIPGHAAGSDKLEGNGKRMRSRKAMDSYESRACIQDSSSIYLYPTKTREMGHESTVREVVVLQWGEEGAYFGVPTQALLGEISR